MKSENKSEEMLDILKKLQGYCPMVEINDDVTLMESVPVVGDQLTVERGVNVIEAVQNSYTSLERLDGIHMEIADWHAVVTFLNVSSVTVQVKNVSPIKSWPSSHKLLSIIIILAISILCTCTPWSSVRVTHFVSSDIQHIKKVLKIFSGDIQKALFNII